MLRWSPNLKVGKQRNALRPSTFIKCFATTALSESNIALRLSCFTFVCEYYSANLGVLRALNLVLRRAAPGLGRESAVRLAKAGATVVLTTRTEAKGEKAVEEVKLGSRAGVR